MKPICRIGVLLPAVLILASGCATKGWVRETRKGPPDHPDPHRGAAGLHGPPRVARVQLPAQPAPGRVGAALPRRARRATLTDPVGGPRPHPRLERARATEAPGDRQAHARARLERVSDRVLV